MKNIPNVFLFNKLCCELFYSSLELHVEDFEHFKFCSSNFFITIQFDKLCFESFDNKVGKNIIDFIIYMRNLKQLNSPCHPLFQKYFKLMLYPDIRSIRLTSDVIIQKIKDKIFSIKSFYFFNSNIDNEALQNMGKFQNIQNITFKNCSFNFNCNFSKLGNIIISIEDCEIESFTMFDYSKVNLKIRNTDIKKIGFGTYKGQHLEIINTNVDTLFLNWSMPNLMNLIYKKDKIQNELFFLGCNAKNIENIVIEGHLLSLDFLNNLSTMVNLKIVGDEYEESYFIHLTPKELEELICKYQNRLNINSENIVFIKSLYLKGLTNLHHLLKMVHPNDINYYFHFYDYVKSSSFPKKEGYFIYNDNQLKYISKFAQMEEINNTCIKHIPLCYFADGHSIYINHEKTNVKNKLVKSIDLNRMASTLKDIITITASQNISFDFIIELLFQEEGVPNVLYCDINFLKLFQNKFINDLNIYYILENYINTLHQKKAIQERYTDTLNKFCAILLNRINMFSTEEKNFLLYFLYSFINNELNLFKGNVFFLPSTIINETYKEKKQKDFINTIIENINIKTSGKFQFFQTELKELINEYFQKFSKYPLHENSTNLNLSKEYNKASEI